MKKFIQWVLAIVFFHILFFACIFSSFIVTLSAYSDLKSVLDYEVPKASMMFMTGLTAVLLYLAMKNRFLGIPYRKITFLLPLLQMVVYTNLGIHLAMFFLNKWAEQEPYSKTWAIVLAISSIIVIRLLMSLFYWKFPVHRQNKGYR
ncbi:hypothetical protein [Paenibacillus sp. NPDC058071]|uniref:hypothetical protein n=1 Tax=Paenibacillus sp. NPDC058071 TaxID=3346326 RepID=UPI0036DB14BA